MPAAPMATPSDWRKSRPNSAFRPGGIAMRHERHRRVAVRRESSWLLQPDGLVRGPQPIASIFGGLKWPLRRKSAYEFSSLKSRLFRTTFRAPKV